MCPQIEPDFSEAAGLKPGQYLARIDESEVKTSKAGNQYLNWKLVTFDNPMPADNDQVIYHSTPFTGKGAGFFKKFVEAAVGEKIGDEIANFNTDELNGRSIMVNIVADDQSTWPKVDGVTAAA